LQSNPIRKAKQVEKNANYFKSISSFLNNKYGDIFTEYKDFDEISFLKFAFEIDDDYTLRDFLSFDDQIKISQKVKELVAEEEKQRWDSLSKEEQEEEKRKIEASLNEGPEVFRGNILQQEWDSIDLARIEKEKKKKEGQDESLE
jgi:hypothetical protein